MVKKALSLCLLLGAFLPPAALAAAPPADSDPFMPVNRAVFHFNRTLDTWIVRPAAVGYERVVPGFAKRGVSNFFNNLDDINVLVNDLLQLKFDMALQDSGRLVVNTTAGLGGLIDVAATLGLYKNQEDFGQTLGYWGVGPGPYLMLPLLGGSSVRDALGLVPDLMLNPVFWLSRAEPRRMLAALDIVHARQGYLAAEALVRGDEYDFLRGAYMQRREYLVNDGAIYDEFDDF